MEEHVGTQREEVRRLVFKYRRDIEYLEEKEAGLVRRIQILENLIPTVLVWYMWKVSRSKKDVQHSQWTEEEAIKKLQHLETLLKELQTADETMKREEMVLRNRIEDVEESLNEDPFANIFVKPSSPLVTLTQDQIKSEIVLMNQKINKMNEKRLQFVDFLEDSDRDWQKTCEELVNEVNTLRDILDQSNVKLKESAMHLKKIGSSIKGDDMIKEKIDDLDNQTKLLYKDVIEQEKKSIAREESQDEKVFSMVQDAMDEVDSLKQVLKDAQKEKSLGDQARKDVGFKTPIIHKITEEEEEEEAETNLGEADSSVVYTKSAKNKLSSLVLDFQDKEFLEDKTSNQKIIVPSTISEIAKESSIERPMTSSLPHKSVDKPGAVEVDTATDIQLPPLAQVDQLQVGKLSRDSLSLQLNILTTRVSDGSVDRAVVVDNLMSKSDLSFTVTSQTVGDKYSDPSKSHLISGNFMPGSSVPVNQNPVSDSPPSQPGTISPFAKFDPEIDPSQIVSPKPTVSKTTPQPLPEKATTSLPETTTEVGIAQNMPGAALFETSTPTKAVPPELTASETAFYQTTSSDTYQPSSPKVISEAPPLNSPAAANPVTTSVRTESVASKARSNQTSEPETVAPQSYLPKSTSETVSPPTNSSKAAFPETTSLKIENDGYRAPYQQTGPSQAVSFKPSAPEENSETVPPPTIPEGAFSDATSLKTETAVSKASSNQTGVTEIVTNQSYPTDNTFKAVSPSPSTLPTATPTIALAYHSEFSSKPEEQSSKSVADSVSVIPGKASESQEGPASANLNLGNAAGNTITSTPYEVPNTDGDLPTSSELMFKQEPATSKSRPSMDDQTLQSKCRVKDHLIKSLADQLREQARGDIWSGSKLLNTVSGDPVRTYDFDRHTLAKYLKGEGPKDIDASLRSDPAYSNTNQLNVKVLRKLDPSSLMIRWGPAPPHEVVGFQIFIDGEFIYWVHSAARNMALLQPLNLSNKLEIAVSPVDSKGNIISRSSITYTP